jgi:hypothetical protein
VLEACVEIAIYVVKFGHGPTLLPGDCPATPWRLPRLPGNCLVTAMTARGLPVYFIAKLHNFLLNVKFCYLDQGWRGPSDALCLKIRSLKGRSLFYNIKFLNCGKIIFKSKFVYDAIGSELEGDLCTVFHGTNWHIGDFFFLDESSTENYYRDDDIYGVKKKTSGIFVDLIPSKLSLEIQHQLNKVLFF